MTSKLGLRRHLDGWQLGVTLVAAALLAAALAVPRSAPPSHIPLPAVATGDLSADQQLDDQRAKRARELGLSFEIRTLGEYFRRYGAAEHEAGGRKSAGLTDRLQDVEASMRGLRRLRSAEVDEHLLQLRALQSELFVGALMAWSGEQAPADLTELGGNLTNAPGHAGWFVGGRFVASPATARVLFKARWNQVCGVTDVDGFRATPNEAVLLLRFLLTHPDGVEPMAQHQNQLLVLEALSKRQPEYPINFARGSVLYQLGNYQLAGAAFQAHIDAHPDGPWSLRARNHLLAALERQKQLELGQQ